MAALLILLASPGVVGQSPRDPGSTRQAQLEPGDPVPYERDEFSPALQQLYRGLVVFTGSIPVTVLYSRLGFVATRFTVESIRRGSLALETVSALAPPGSDPQAAAINQEDTRVILFSALAASAVIAGIDWLLVRAGR